MSCRKSWEDRLVTLQHVVPPRLGRFCEQREGESPYLLGALARPLRRP